MADVPTPPMPGEMTVPPLFGWETVAVALLVLLAVLVAVAALAAARAGRAGRPEFEAWLEARSARRHEPGAPPGEPAR